MQTALKFYRLNQKEESYLPLGSARGCKQTLSIVPHVSIERNLKGNLLCLGNPVQKYISTIVCKDKIPPALEGIFSGTQLRVECIQRLVTPLVKGGHSVTLQRKAVPEDVFFLQEYQETPLLLDSENSVNLSEDQGSGYISYRPILDMIVIDHTVETDEWGAALSWKLLLHEI